MKPPFRDTGMNKGQLHGPKLSQPTQPKAKRPIASQRQTRFLDYFRWGARVEQGL